MTKDIIFCVCDKNDVVLEQSQLSQDFCGNRVGLTCPEGCQKYLKLKKDEPGSILLKNRTVYGRSVDIVRYEQKDSQVIILIPKEDSVSEISNLKTLTVKEKEVAILIVKGYSNQEILMELNILKSTLKTHINRIYQKLDSSFQKYRGLIKN